MADGTVTIDLDLNKGDFMSDLDSINGALKAIGVNVDTDTIESKFNAALSKVRSQVDETVNDINSKHTSLKISANDDELKDKVNQAVAYLQELPKEKRTELVAQLHEQGFNSWRELLASVPKDKHTELLADIQEGNINKFNSLINHIKKEKVTKLKAKESGNGANDFKEKLTRIPKTKDTTLKATDEASGPIKRVVNEEDNAITKSHTLKDVMMGTFAGNLIQNGINAITSGIKNMTQAGEAYNVQQDTMKINWENLTREAPQDGQNMINMINNFAQHSIYSADALDKMAQSFYHVHSNAQETQKWTQDFVNLGSTLHVSNDALAEAAEQFAKVEAGGKANAMDMQMMINRFPMFGEALEKATGKSMSQLYQLSAQGKLTSDVFSQALDYLGTKYKSSQAEAMTSFQGMSMHLKSQFSVLSGDIMSSSFSMSKSTLAAIQKITDDKSMQTYANLISQAFANVMSGVSKVIQYVSSHKDEIMAVIKNIASIAGTFGGEVWGTIKTIVDGIASAFNKLSGNAKKSNDPLKSVATALGNLAKNKTAIKTLADVLLGLFAAKKVTKFASGLTKTVKSFKEMSSVLGAFSGPVALVVTAIAGLSVAFVGLYKHNAKFRNFVNGLVKSAQNFFKSGVKWFKNAFKSIGDFFTGTTKWQRDFTKSLNNMIKGVIDWGKNIGKNVGSAVNNMKNVVVDGMRTIQHWWNSVWNGISSFFKGIWDGIVKWVKWYITAVKDSINDKLKFIQNLWNSIWKAISDFITPIWNGIKKLVSDAINAVHDTISGVLDKINTVWTNMWNSLSSFFQGIWKDIKQAAQDGINGVINIINGGIDGIDSVWKFFTGHETSIHHLKPVHFEQGGIVDRHLSMVNDGTGPDWKELIETPDGQLMMSNERNAVLPLEPGTRVYNGAETKQIMNMLGVEHYANGGVVGDLIDWGSHKLSDFGSWIKDKWDAVTKFLKHPLENTKAIIAKAISGPIAKISNQNMVDLGKGVFDKLANNISDWFKKGLEKAKDDHDASAGGFGSIPDLKNGAELRDIIKDALKANGLPTSDDYVNAWLRQVATESGGNAHAVQPGADPDGDGSGPALGLLQTKRGTFNAYKAPGHNDIFNAYDNALAAINYAKHTYGSRMLSFIGHGHGYADGGHVYKPEYALIAEDGDEFAINPSKPSADRLLLEAAQERLTYSPDSVIANAIASMNNAKAMNGRVAPTISYTGNNAPAVINNNGNHHDNRNVNVSFEIDGRAIAQATYPFNKMLQGNDIRMQMRKGGAF